MDLIKFLYSIYMCNIPYAFDFTLSLDSKTHGILYIILSITLYISKSEMKIISIPSACNFVRQERIYWTYYVSFLLWFSEIFILNFWNSKKRVHGTRDIAQFVGDTDYTLEIRVSVREWRWRIRISRQIFFYLRAHTNNIHVIILQIISCF